MEKNVFDLFTKSERSGLLVLAGLIILLQSIIWGWDYVPLKTSRFDVKSVEVQAFQKEIDSLKRLQSQKTQTISTPFNPNYLTDYKAYLLGLSPVEFDRLAAYRKQNKFVNSPEEFQKVTGVHDSILAKIKPFFKFPDWVTNKAQNSFAYQNSNTNNFETVNSKNIPKAKSDLNTATKEELMAVYGVGDKLSDMILKYRAKLQGYTWDNQLYEVWGLSRETADKVLERFTVLTPPFIEKKNINNLTFKELLHTPYMDYELTQKIFNYKKVAGKITAMEVLKKIDGFPMDKFEKINLYLEAE